MAESVEWGMQKRKGCSCPYIHLSMQWKHNTILTTLCSSTVPCKNIHCLHVSITSFSVGLFVTEHKNSKCFKKGRNTLLTFFFTAENLRSLACIYIKALDSNTYCLLLFNFSINHDIVLLMAECWSRAVTLLQISSFFSLFIIFLVETVHVWMIIPSGFGSCAAWKNSCSYFCTLGQFLSCVTMAKKYCLSYNWKQLINISKPQITPELRRYIPEEL